MKKNLHVEWDDTIYGWLVNGVAGTYVFAVVAYVIVTHQ